MSAKLASGPAQSPPAAFVKRDQSADQHFHLVDASDSRLAYKKPGNRLTSRR